MNELHVSFWQALANIRRILTIRLKKWRFRVLAHSLTQFELIQLLVQCRDNQTKKPHMQRAHTENELYRVGKNDDITNIEIAGNKRMKIRPSNYTEKKKNVGDKT